MANKDNVEQSFADFIEKIAVKAGLKVEKLGPSMVVVPYLLVGERHQNVFIRPMGMTANKNLIVGLLSPARKLEAGEELDRTTANALLRENAKLAHGAWALDTIEGQEYLMALDTLIAQTLVPEEFRDSASAVAGIADAMEKKLGRDDF